MESRPPQLSLDELHLLRWLTGGSLMLLAIATVFYLDIDAGVMAILAAAGVAAGLVWPTLPARVPVWAHRLAFPAIAAFFAIDLWHSGQLLPAIVRLDLLLMLYLGLSHRARRDDLQLVVLGLFLIVVAGVLTVSLLFALQILVFTACALGLLMVVTIISSTEGGNSPKLAVRGVVPPWAARADWRHLFVRLREVSDWRLLASAVLLFLGVVAVSGLLFMAIPRFQLENSLFLERFVTKKAMTGFSDSIKFGDITEISQDDGVAFDADLSDPTRAPLLPYWRMVVLDEYHDGGFKMSAYLKGKAGLGGERTAANILTGGHGTFGAPTWTIYLEAGVSRYLPLLGPFDALRFREAQNFRFSYDLGMVSLRDEPAAMTAYRVDAMAPDTPLMKDRAFSLLRRNPARVRPDKLQTQLEVSSADAAALRAMAAEAAPRAGAGASAFVEQADAWLRRRHAYSLAPRIPPGAGDPLVRWMASRESGHCELFAGALVLLARTSGYSAHVVTGFRGGTWNAYSGNYTIRNSDAHAWAEIWDETAQAWRRVDPLAGPGASAVTQDTSGAGFAGVTDRSWSARINSIRVFWYRRIVNFDQQSQVETFKAAKAATENSGRWLQNLFAQVGLGVRSLFSGPWNTARLLRVVAVAAALVAVGWLALALRRVLPGRRGARRFDPVRREAGRWLARVEGPKDLVGDLQRLRYGPAATWPRPREVFSRARQASSVRRRRPASSRSTS